MVYLNESSSWVQHFKCYEQLKVVDDISYQVHELKSLDGMNNSRLWMICTILGRELKDLNVISCLRLWMM